MPNRSKAAVAAKFQTPDRLPIFGPPPLLAGENAAAYNDLLARASGDLKPSDIFEEIWVREIVDLIWETLRWRRHLANVLAAAIPKVLEGILKPLMQNQAEAVSHGGGFLNKLKAAQALLNGGPKLANDWAAGDPAAIECVNVSLASAGLTMDNVVAQAVSSELDKIERFKGGDQGECEPAKHGPDTESGNRVTGAGAHTAKSKAKEEGEVHVAPPPHQHRSARRGVLRT